MTTAQDRPGSTRGFSPHLHAAIVAALDDAIIIHTLQGEILDWNMAAETLYGYTAKELTGQSLAKLLPRELAEALPLLSRRLRAGERIDAHEATIVTQGGGKRTVSVAVLPLDDGAGRIVGACSIVRDRAPFKHRRRTDESTRQFSGRLLQAQDEERRRIARELHDGLTQQVVAIIWNVERAISAAGTADLQQLELLRKAAELARQVAQDVRDLSHLLHPPLLDEVGLESAIDWYARRFAAQTGIQVEVSIAAELPRLPSESETALFRIVQEALTNVRRHSGSAVARIHLGAEDSDQIRLEIADEGKGSSNATLQKQSEVGVGVRGMRERMKQLGGRLEISSSRSGTIVRALLPLPPKAPIAAAGAASSALAPRIAGDCSS
jgi:PAS domain S-box-containing protein